MQYSSHAHRVRMRPPVLRMAVIGIVSIYGLTMVFWPVQAIKATPQLPESRATETVSLNWPSSAQSAVGALGHGVVATHGNQEQAPMASITKLVTALTVLEAKPLSGASGGPQLVFDDDDVDRYYRYLALDGVVGPVTPGTSISQYDAMQIMLVASANNYAESLAVWAYGSVENYLTAANDYLALHGLDNTSVADAAGFSVQSVSTTEDLVQLAELALQESVIRSIVSKPSVTVEGYGTFYSTNLLIEDEGVIGVKTGTTDEAGNCLVYAATYNLNGKELVVIGATLNAPDRLGLADEARTLLEQARAGFDDVTIAVPEQTLALYDAPWSEAVSLTAEQTYSAIAWKGSELSYTLNAPDYSAGETPEATATLKVNEFAQDIPLRTDKSLTSPSIWWRLTHPHVLLSGA